LFPAGAGEWRQESSNPHQRDDSYLAEWQDLLACVCESKVPQVTGEDGLRVLEMIEAALKSSASAELVTVSSVANTDRAKS
jgi:predicted dehydrogenase